MSARGIVKALLPPGIMNLLRVVREVPALGRLPRQPVEADALPRITREDLARIWAREDLAAAWGEDRERIVAAFGSPALLGGVNPGDRQAIFYLALARAPSRVLEVGTHVGASTLTLACALARAGQGVVTSVDVLDVNADDGPWRAQGSRAAPAALAEQLGVARHVEFVRAPALQVLAETHERFDLVFLDGDHTAAAVYQEVAAASRVLAPGGWILLHDVYPQGRPLFRDGKVIPGPWRALERHGREDPRVTVLPLGALPWPTKQGSRLTSLALVTRRL